MAKKAEKIAEQTSSPKKFRVVNNTENCLAVPVYDETGTVKHLNLRIQGRGGQIAPVIEEREITEGARIIERKGLIRLVPVS